jgi:hypothetical protein
MAIGPVQLIVLGFNHPNFHGEVIEELERSERRRHSTDNSDLDGAARQ